MVIAAACLVGLLLGVVVTLAISRRAAATATPVGEELLPTGTVTPARDRLQVVATDTTYELSLDKQWLMTFEPVAQSDLPARAPLATTYAAMLASLLDNPQIAEVLTGGRYVLAKVPDVIRDGGRWMTSADGVTKAVALAPDTRRIAALPTLVTGGAAAGTAAVFWPAVIGVAAAALAQQQLSSALAGFHRRLLGIENRLRDADLGVVRGAQRLVDQVAEFGPPHLWPEQLRFELAVRRAALDPVCFAQLREAERLIDEGRLSGTDRERLERGVGTLVEATLVRAQLDLATTMILLDGGDAPFGLERLGAAQEEFARDLGALHELVEAALPEAPLGRIRHPDTSRTISTLEGLHDELTAIHVGLHTDRDLVLSMPDGETLTIEVTEPLALTQSDSEPSPEEPPV